VSEKAFKFCRVAITLSVAALLGWSVVIGQAMPGLIAVLVGLALLYFCRSRSRTTLEDERNYRISEKASRMTLRLFGVIAGITGVVLMILGRSGHGELGQIGFILGYSVCALLVLYLIFYGYYSRTHGG